VKVECLRCGHDRFTFNVTDALLVCKNDDCGHSAEVIDRHRLKRLADRRIPVIAAGQDCPYTNQCREAAAMNCHRAAFQGEDFPCVFARMFESEAAA